MGSLLKVLIPLVALTAIAFAAQLRPEVQNSKNWGMNAVDAVEALDYTQGSPKVVVAVIDTGIDARHEFLAGSLWSSGGRGIASYYGWNFLNDKPNPNDDHGHGTHVAGIIHQVSPLATILPIKYYSDANSGAVNLRNTVSAIRFAISKKVKIINYSGGGPEFSEDEYLALKEAEAKGILVVAAAGNEHENTDLVYNYYYPASYRLSNVISVGNVDSQNYMVPSSNYGKARVDVAAPGEHIFSSLPGNRYGWMTGTSQATPFVSGIAAQLWACNSKLTYVQVKSIIESTVDKYPQLENKIRTGGKVNALAALNKAMVKGHCAR